jgi:sugar phosphate isomerase/epimerase
MDSHDFAEEIMVPAIKRSLDVAAVFGAKTAVQHAFHRESLRKVVDHAEKVGVKICIENGWSSDPKRGLLIADGGLSNPKSQIEYIEAIGSSWPAACLDTGHAALPINGVELWEYVHALGKNWLQALHVQDNSMRGTDEHKFPFFGAIEWEKVAKALGEIDYEGSFTYEAYGIIGGNMPDEFAPTAVKYAADIGRFLCDIIDANRPK